MHLWPSSLATADTLASSLGLTLAGYARRRARPGRRVTVGTGIYPRIPPMTALLKDKTTSMIPGTPGKAGWRLLAPGVPGGTRG